MRHALPLLLLFAACSPRGGEDARTPNDSAAPAEGQATEAAASAPTGRPAAEVGAMRSFRSWEAACDNTRTCTLFGFAGPEGETPELAFIRIERAGTPDAGPAIILAGGEWTGEEQASEAVLQASVDGGRGVAVPVTGGEFGPYYAGELRGAEARALVAALRNGRTLTLAIRGFPPGAVSLDGAAAALLWADERQGRVGTTTALARPGNRPMTAQPPAPPRVRAVRPLGGEVKEPAALLRRPEVAACQAEQPDSAIAEVTGARLTAELVLWEIPCGAGAYNQTTAFYFSDAAGGGLRPAPLGEPKGEGDLPANQAVNAGLDPMTGQIAAFNKGRGIGDCGSEQAWAWDGARFVLVHERVMGRCEGVGVDLWPMLHRADVR